MIRQRIIALILIPVFFVSLAAGVVLYQLHQTVDTDQVFEIPPGDNLSSISRRLVAMDILPVDDALFKAIALLTRDEGAILAGQYQITADMTAVNLLELFRSGSVIQYRLTFPEGWTLDDWLIAMAEAPHLEFVSARLTRAELAARLGLSSDPEGWFFPDTYVYRKGDTDLTILNQAHRRMQDILDEEWLARGHVAHIQSPAEALTLASIIEKETGFDPDRPKIASVFHNRLTQGMKLQSDPTVIFGLGDSFDGDLKRSHLKTDTLYNTYTRAGLTPGPICSPGRASIKAALAGSAHGYLYFVAMGGGKSFFSATLDEHNRAVNQYQKQRKSDP